MFDSKMKLALLLGTAGLATTLSVVGCGNKSPDGKPDASVTISADVNDDTAAAAKAKLEKLQSQADETITELKSKAKDAKEDAKDKYDEAIAKLEKQKEAAKEQMAELGDKADDSWSSLKQGVKSAISDLDVAITEAKNELTE